MVNWLIWNVIKSGLFFNKVSFQFAYSFHRCCSAWIPLRKMFSFCWPKKTQQQPISHYLSDADSKPRSLFFQMGWNQGYKKRDQLVQNHKHPQQSLKPETEHHLDKIRPLMSVFLGIWSWQPFVTASSKLAYYYPLMLWPFWRYSINSMPFASSKPKFITFPVDKTTFGPLWRVEGVFFHYIDCPFSHAQSNQPNT